MYEDTQRSLRLVYKQIEETIYVTLALDIDQELIYHK